MKVNQMMLAKLAENFSNKFGKHSKIESANRIKIPHFGFSTKPTTFGQPVPLMDAM